MRTQHLISQRYALDADVVFSRIFACLAGCPFQGVPVDSVEQPLRKLFSSWSSTKIVEDAINVEKSLQSVSQSGTHKCGELFGQLLATNLLEATDRPQPSVDADTLAASRALFKIPRKRFHQAELAKSSLDKDHLLQLGSPSYTSPVAEKWRAQGLSTVAMLECKADP